MKIALIWPNGLDTKSVLPLSLGYLKSNINPEDNDIKIFDCALNNIKSDSPGIVRMIKEFEPQLVGISCWSATYKESISILEKVKAMDKNIITLMGGIHATTHYDKVIKNKVIDFLFRGEAEFSFPKFIDELQEKNSNFSIVGGLVYYSNKGDLIINRINRERDLDKIKIPDYNAIKLDNYIKKGYRYSSYQKYNAPIWISRGCPYQCEYCTGPMMNGKFIRYHSIEYVIKWIKYLYYKKGVRMINIIDDNFSFYPHYVKVFCRAIINLGLRNLHLGTPNGIRIQHSDEELFELMKQAGWEYLVIAPESGSIKTLKHMRKGITPSIVQKKVKEIKKAGLKVIGFFMVGYPSENQYDLEKTAKLIRKCKFNFFWIFTFQPLPGTAIYKKLIESGEISSNFLPEKFSTEKNVYKPKKLQNYNFSFFKFKEYIYWIIRNPVNILFIFRLYNYKLIIERTYIGIKEILKNLNYRLLKKNCGSIRK